MINLKKTEIYKKYKGDMDLWMTSAAREEIDVFEEGEWSQIDFIVQDLGVQKAMQEKEPSSKLTEEDHTIKGQTFTPISEKDAQKSNDYAMRFIGLVNKSEYETVLDELYKIA